MLNLLFFVLGSLFGGLIGISALALVQASAARERSAER